LNSSALKRERKVKSEMELLDRFADSKPSKEGTSGLGQRQKF
jgi:hypothetical protein